jgi:hypothetical protein
LKSYKDFLLGLGLGLIFTALFWIVSLHSPVNDTDVIQRAQELGMVFPKDLGAPQTVLATTESTKEAEDEIAKENTLVSKEEETVVVKSPEEKIVSYTVSRGSSAKQVADELYALGVISDANQLVEELKKMQLTAKVKARKLKFDIANGPVELYTVIRELTK